MNRHESWSMLEALPRFDGVHQSNGRELWDEGGQ